MAKQKVVAVDFDGTLAHYERPWKGVEHCGDPIPVMQLRVRALLARGVEVRIFTARVYPRPDGSHEEARKHIEDWCERHLGRRLVVTHEKSPDIDEIWDDKAVGVTENKGYLRSPSKVWSVIATEQEDFEW